MPYNPGVQSQAGQFYAQGLSSLGAGIGQGIKQYNQNKIMAGQGVAKFEATAKANPEILQFLTTPDAPQEAAKAYEKLKKDGTLNVRDAAFLAQFSDTFQQETQAKQQAQMRSLQMKQMEAQTAQSQREMANQAAAQAQLAQAFAPKQPMSDAIMQGANFQQLQGIPAQGGDPSMMEVVRRFGKSGAPVTPEVTRFLQSGLEAEARQGGKPQPVVGPIRQIHSTDAKGNPIIRSVDSLTGKELGSGPTQRLYPSPEEAGATELAKETAKRAAETTSKFITDLSEKAEHARATIADTEAIGKLYEAGAQSGFGQQFVTPTKAALARIGLGDEKLLANQQLLETKLRERALGAMQEFNRGQGAVSEYERRIFAAAVANPNNTKDTNMALVQFSAAVAKRTLALDAEKSKLKEQGVSDAAIQQRILQMRSEMPIPSIGMLIQSASSQPQEPSGPAPSQSLQIKSVKRVSP